MGILQKRIINRTQIPNYLQALPKMKFHTYRKYREDFQSPKSLLDLCCEVICNHQKFFSTLSQQSNWPSLREMFLLNSRITNDSYRKLGHIPNPIDATAYLLDKARNRHMDLASYLRFIRIIRDETQIHRKLDEDLSMHWNRISPKRPQCPATVIGAISR